MPIPHLTSERPVILTAADSSHLTPARPVILSGADSPQSGESAESKDLAADCATTNRKGISARTSTGLRWQNSLMHFWLYPRRRGPSIAATFASRTTPPLRMTAFFLRRHVYLLLLALAVFTLLGAGDESARVNDLGHRMMCVCGCNQILLECNHVGCAYSDRMRAELVAAVDRGDNDDLTLQSFVQKYGPPVLAAPTKAGFDRVAWIAPYLALVLGLGLVIFVIRGWKSRPLVLSADAPAPVHGADLDRFRAQARKETE